MAAFKPFEMRGVSLEDQIMSWDKMIQPPYDKNAVDCYTRTRVILMNGIETNSVLTSHCMDRMMENDEIKRQLAMIRRIDAQHQQTVDWLNPANQSIAETTIGYEQVAVDLTSNLAKNEKDQYFKQVLDFALLEDFDHLFRYGCLLEVLHGIDPNSITQGQTEIKPGRPTEVEHRHPFDEMRKHWAKGSVSVKTHMNYHTIVSGEQQTMLFYKTHGNMYTDDLARKLYAEIAEIEQQHVSQYEQVANPDVSPLERMAMIQLNEAYNYFSCAETEVDSRIRSIWAQFAEHEVEHFFVINGLMKQYEDRDIRDIMDVETIEPLIVFESNKDYVNEVLETQVRLQPHNMEFVPEDQLPHDWPSFRYRKQVNAGGVPSEIVVERAKQEAHIPAVSI